MNGWDMRILLAEDEAQVRAFLLRALTIMCPQAEIIPVGDGKLALEIFYSSGADLIISDHHMPQLSGMELLQTIRRTSEVPFVLISADNTVAEPAHAAGATGFLHKPFSLTALRQAVQYLMPAV
jgi:CheY-like chemotaxis protein